MSLLSLSHGPKTRWRCRAGTNVEPGNSSHHAGDYICLKTFDDVWPVNTACLIAGIINYPEQLYRGVVIHDGALPKVDNGLTG